MPAPSLSPDLGYAGSSTGIGAYEPLFPAQVSGTAADAANDRLLAVGTSENAGATHDILIVAHHADGSLDRGYQGGEFTLPLSPGDDASGVAIAVLPDHRVLVLGTVVDNGGLSKVVLARLNPSGSLDGDFGNAGIESFSVGAGDAHPTRRPATPTGASRSRAGPRRRRPGQRPGRRHLRRRAQRRRHPDRLRRRRRDPGRPARPGRGLRPRRPRHRHRLGGRGRRSCRRDGHDDGARDGIHEVALHAFRADGSDDPGFNDGTADETFGTDGLNTVPSGLIAYGGRLWMTATITRDDIDSDGLLARVESDGTDLQQRRFDLPAKSDQDVQIEAQRPRGRVR